MESPRRDVATMEIENLWGRDHELVDQTMAGDESDGAVSADTRRQPAGVEAPMPVGRAVMLVHDEVLLGLLGRDRDHTPAEVSLRREAVCEPRRVLRFRADQV